jgi:hypothetical protein
VRLAANKSADTAVSSPVTFAPNEEPFSAGTTGGWAINKKENNKAGKTAINFFIVIFFTKIVKLSQFFYLHVT